MSSEPIVIAGYHRTKRCFVRFDPDLSETEYGCFFADRPEGAIEYADALGGRILVATLRFANPYRCTAREWAWGTASDPADVAAEGTHDGYLIEGLDSGNAFIAWRNATIADVRVLCTYGTPEFDLVRTAAFAAGVGGYADLTKPISTIHPQLQQTRE